MKYFGINRKLVVESKYWEGPKERLKQHELVTHRVEISASELAKTGMRTGQYTPWIDSQYPQFDKSIKVNHLGMEIYFNGKRKDLQEEFGKLNEVKV